MAAVETCYTSCGCNRTPHCVDWGKNGLVCFGACRSVALCKPEFPSSVIATLAGHKGRVESVQWIRKPNSEAEDELISASADCSAIVWQNQGCGTKFEAIATLKGHSATVTMATGIYVPGGLPDCMRTLVATTSADSSVRVWQRTARDEEFQMLQSILFGSGFALCLEWVLLPDISKPLLACGCDDTRVHLFVEDDTQFSAVHQLWGHEDWIRDLSVTVDDAGDVLLASCAQDCYIRVWRVSRRHLAAGAATTQRSIDELLQGEEIKLKETVFSFLQKGEHISYAVTLESVMQGHENWIYSIQWEPEITKDGGRHQSMCLLSASMDKTVIIWRPDPEMGVWIEKVRVGDVGGNSLGFYGGVFSPDGQSILAHGYQGALQMWRQETDAALCVPVVTSGGHFGPVQDLVWQPDTGQFVLTVSADQTARLHSYWTAEDDRQSAWHEIARPQIHGYDLQCITMIDKFSFACGADEKVVRVFKAPVNFIDNFRRLCSTDTEKDMCDKQYYEGLPEGASGPALGLSNKAIYLEQVATQDKELYGAGDLRPQLNPQYSEAYFAPLQLSEPPKEGDLLQNTLWPEIQKLYGHGFEIFALACHPNGTVLASACKASKTEHAAVILWDVLTWKAVCRLEAHSLTVTRLMFSHSGAELLSVSRDRTWSLFRHRPSGAAESEPLYTRVAFTDKKSSLHTRIIWTCAWSHDDQYFVTVSRDKKAIIWGHGPPGGAACLGDYRACSMPLDLGDSVTAVDFAPVLCNNCYLLAFGLDGGEVVLYKWISEQPQTTSSWTKCVRLEQSEAHHLTVKQLRFRPQLGTLGHRKEEGSEVSEQRHLQLASCGMDNALKIYTVHLDKL